MSVGGCRIRDVVRDSKIRWDIQSQFDRKFEVDYNLQPGFSHYGRVFPRSSQGDEQHYLRYVDFVSSFDETASGFYGCNGKEDHFHGFYHKYGESDSLIGRFKRNLPDFDGFWHIEDLLSWIEAIEDFFEEVSPPEHLKCKIVWYKTKGAAYYWWKQLQDDRYKHGKEEIISWPRMRKLLISRFAPSNCSTKVHSESDGNKHNGTADLRIYGASEVIYEGDRHSKEMSEVKPTKCVMEFPMLSSNETTKDEDQIEEATDTTVVTHLKFKPACSLDADNLQVYLMTPAAIPSSLINHRSLMEEFVGPYVAQRCKLVKVGVVLYVRKEKTQVWVLLSWLGDYSRMVVLLFDPGGNTYLLTDWSFKKSQLSCSVRLTGSISGTIIFTLHSNGVIGNIFANILENPTVDFDKIISDQLEVDITGERIVGVEHEATVIIMVLKNGSQVGYTFSAPNDVLRLGTYDVHFFVEEMLMCDFDLGGNAIKALMFEGLRNKFSMLSNYHLVEQFYNHVLSPHTEMNKQRECLDDDREVACSLIYASVSLVDMLEYFGNGNTTEMNDPRIIDVVESMRIGIEGSKHEINASAYKSRLYRRRKTLKLQQVNSVVRGEAQHLILAHCKAGVANFQLILQADAHMLVCDYNNDLMLIFHFDPGGAQGRDHVEGHFLIWEPISSGLTEFHQIIVQNGLRERVILRVDDDFGKRITNWLARNFKRDGGLLKDGLKYVDTILTGANFEKLCFDLLGMLKLKDDISVDKTQAIKDVMVVLKQEVMQLGQSQYGQQGGELWAGPKLKQTSGDGDITNNYNFVLLMDTCFKEDRADNAATWDFWPHAVTGSYIYLSSGYQYHHLHITRGRVMSWEGWNDINNANTKEKFIKSKLSVVTISLCLMILCEKRQFKKTLKLFHKLVNGLDTPLDVDDKCVRLQCGFLRVRSWTSFRVGGWYDVGTSK